MWLSRYEPLSAGIDSSISIGLNTLLREHPDARSNVFLHCFTLFYVFYVILRYFTLFYVFLPFFTFFYV